MKNNRETRTKTKKWQKIIENQEQRAHNKDRKERNKMKRFNLILFRMKHGLTQRERAERLKLSKNHYSNIENAIYDPSYKALERFREEFPAKSIDIWEVFKKEEREEGAKVE